MVLRPLEQRFLRTRSLLSNGDGVSYGAVTETKPYVPRQRQKNSSRTKLSERVLFDNTDHTQCVDGKSIENGPSRSSTLTGSLWSLTVTHRPTLSLQIPGPRETVKKEKGEEAGEGPEETPSSPSRYVYSWEKNISPDRVRGVTETNDLPSCVT